MTVHLVRGVKHIANTPRSLIRAMALVFFGCSLAYMLIEDKGPVASMWWAIVTASTVGYGDQYPESTAGRFVGAVLIVSYVIFLMIGSAQLTANLIADPDCFSDSEQEQLKADVARILVLIEGNEPVVQHQIIVKGLSDLSNEDIRKLTEVQRTANDPKA